MFNIIERYINILSKDQINNFAVKNNVILSSDELDFLYIFIKKNYKEVLANPSLLNLERYEKKFSKENFTKIKKLYTEYLSKYRAYL